MTGGVRDDLRGTAVGAALEHQLQAGELTKQAYERRWQQELEHHRPLPMPFRDSPEAVRALEVQDAEFVAGDIHLILEARVLPSGRAIWRSEAYGVEYQTPFAANGSSVSLRVSYSWERRCSRRSPPAVAPPGRLARARLPGG